MTIRAIFAIFHSFCRRWKVFTESRELLWLWVLPLIFPTALQAQTRLTGAGMMQTLALTPTQQNQNRGKRDWTYWLVERMALKMKM